MQVRGRTAGLRQGTAAGCRSLRDRVCRQAFSPQSTAAGCGTRSGCKFRIQDSKFRIAQSGCSLRRARSKRPYGTRAAGLRRREAAACSAFSRPISIRREPAAEQWACDVKEQPSARRRLRPTAAPIRAQIHDSEFKISCGPPTLTRSILHAKHARSRADGQHRPQGSCSPPPGGGCGLLRFLIGTANSSSDTNRMLPPAAHPLPYSHALSDISSERIWCVRAPTEMKSTPHSA